MSSTVSIETPEYSLDGSKYAMCVFDFSKTWHWVSENLLYNILRVYSDPNADDNYRYLIANQKRIGSWKKRWFCFTRYKFE